MNVAEIFNEIEGVEFVLWNKPDGAHPLAQSIEDVCGRYQEQFVVPIGPFWGRPGLITFSYNKPEKIGPYTGIALIKAEAALGSRIDRFLEAAQALSRVFYRPVQASFGSAIMTICHDSDVRRSAAWFGRAEKTDAHRFVP